MRFAQRRPTTAVLRAAAVVVTLAGCGGYNSMFPNREDIFKPIPVNLGEELVREGDTSYVLPGRGYRLVVKDREILPDAKTTLDRMGSSWRQFFAADPAVLTVVLQSPPPKPKKEKGEKGEKGEAGDRAPAPGGVRPSDGTLVLQVGKRFPEDDPREAMNARMIEGQIAMPVARAWLASLANGGAPVTDTTNARRVRWTPSNPRMPDWIETAVPQLVAGASDGDFVAAEVVRQMDKLPPLRALLSATRPVVPGDTVRRGDDRRAEAGGREAHGGPPRGGRNAPSLEGARLFDAQAVTFAEFLADREGRQFVGRVVAATLAAGSIEPALREAMALPHDIDALDRAWRSWLQDRAASAGERAGR